MKKVEREVMEIITKDIPRTDWDTILRLSKRSFNDLQTILKIQRIYEPTNKKVIRSYNKLGRWGRLFA